jgi:hypothetical protein
MCFPCIYCQDMSRAYIHTHTHTFIYIADPPAADQRASSGVRRDNENYVGRGDGAGDDK